MEKNKLSGFLTIIVLTVITLVFWVFFSVIRIFINKPSPTVAEELLKPVNPVLDSRALENLENRLYFEEDQIPDSAPAFVVSTPVAEPASEFSSSLPPEDSSDQTSLDTEDEAEISEP